MMRGVSKNMMVLALALLVGVIFLSVGWFGLNKPMLDAGLLIAAGCVIIGIIKIVIQRQT